MPTIRAPRGTQLNCKSWQQEGALRMLCNNLDPDVAEKPEELIVYGGNGKAARNWEAFDAIVVALKRLENDETLLVQSGKPVAVFKTHAMAPRVIISNSMLVPAWANDETFADLEAKGLMMYGQMTAGSWIYIGTQGILHHTYETFAEVGRRNFGGSLTGRLVLTAGLGGMGGAQPLAVTMAGGVVISVDVDAQRIERRVSTGYLDQMCLDLDEAVALAETAKREGRALSIGLLGNASTVFDTLSKRGFKPDVVTDQTSAHDLGRYVPAGISLAEADAMRGTDLPRLHALARQSVVVHVEAMLRFQAGGAVTFDYGNNIREQARIGGVADAMRIPGFVQEYVRPAFCLGRGPFRWAALSGDPADIRKIDEMVIREFAHDESLVKWIDMAQKRVQFQGLPARICWLGYGERDRFGLIVNAMVRRGELSAPIVIGRDHFDTGSVASPYRETEGMLDGSDAVADWPILNALLSTAGGATWVSVHHGGGVGMGYSIHAGQVIVADGTPETDERMRRVLRNDPGLGVIRHADAGYDTAIELLHKSDLQAPMLRNPNA